MEQRLDEAEITENVTSLNEVNEFNLDRAVVKFLNWTPLHAAASRGQQELFQGLLNRNPELADALDSQQRSLLHLASANGHIEIVKALIQVRPEMCLTRDRDGANPLHVAAMGGNIEIVKALIQVRPEICLARDRDGANPLHVAAMRGKVEVLDDLFKANPHAARARVESGERETILHLCVKYNQLQFLSKLLEDYFKGKEFVNAKDNAGNTILHLAVADRRLEIIEHVLSHTKIDVNATNANKQTALDILLLGQEKGTEPEGVLDQDILASLQNYHAKRADNPAKIEEEKNQNNREEKKQIIIVAVLLATLAFQAGVAPPGGAWQDDLDGHKNGKAVMASTHPSLYAFFLLFNTSGFISSLCVLVLVMITIDWLPPRKYSQWMSYFKITIITSIATAYFISIVMVSPLRVQKHGRGAVSHFGYIEGIMVLTWAAYFILVVFVIMVFKFKTQNTT